jgi:D-alanine-D-alanine ligase
MHMQAAEMKQKQVAVLLGGLSSEREVSLESGNAVLRALQSRGYRVVAVDVDRLVAQRLLEHKVEVAFIALHGRHGEDGCIQGLLEAMNIPYTGTGVIGSALGMDKVMCKRLFDVAHIPTTKWRYPASRAAAVELGVPLVVKPRAEGSSVGVTVVRRMEELDEALARAGKAPALLERFVKGRELQVAVLGHGEAARCLGSVEVRPAEGIYDYAAKYLRNDTRYLVPAPVPAEVQARLAETAVAVHRLLECSGATRTDMLWDGEGEPLVLEINTLPGLTGHSLLPKIAAHQGMSYEDLVEALLLDATIKTPPEEGARR